MLATKRGELERLQTDKTIKNESKKQAAEHLSKDA